MKAPQTVFTMDKHAVPVRDLASSLSLMGAKVLNYAYADAHYADYHPLARTFPSIEEIGFDSKCIPPRYDFAVMERMSKAFAKAISGGGGGRLFLLRLQHLVFSFVQPLRSADHT